MSAAGSGPVSLADHQALARSRLDANALAYFEGGAADELTVAANRTAWDGMALYPRVLRSLAGGHTGTTLLGRALAHPILLAPVAYQRLAHPDGEIASACAAAAQGAGMVVSTQASISLETIAGAIADDADRGPLWFQLYLQHDRGFNRELVARAEAAGYEALVLTVDAPCSGARDRERRTGFALPPDISAVNLAGLPPRPQAGAPAFAPGWSTRPRTGTTSPGCSARAACRSSSRASSIPPTRALRWTPAHRGSSSPTTEDGSSTPPSRPHVRCRQLRMPWATASRYWLTEASAAAPTYSRQSRWAPTRY